ncbi:hypothetical protein [Caudoviricetes sp.]|nr:hypothetical protein [Caudoviricetes sp.]
MDLNDPRRRLQVLQNNNPSLRVSVSPQQPKISIAQPKPVAQPQIIVPKSPVQQPQQQAPQIPQNRFKAIQLDEGKNKTIFGWNAAALLPKNYEKTYGVNTKDYDFNNEDEFLKYFDTRDKEFQRAYISRVEQQAKDDPVAARTLVLLKNKGRFGGDVTDFMEGANERLYGGIGRGLLRGTDFILPGHNTFGLEKLADQQDPSKNGTRQFTQSGKVGETVGTAEKAIFDIASLVAGSSAAEQAASKVPMFTNTIEKLQQGGKASQILAKALGILPGSLGGSTTDILQTAGRGDEQNVGKSLAVGTAIDLGIPVLGSTVKRGFNLFKGSGSKSFSFIDDLIGETDPSKIKNVLGDIDDDMATFLAQETNPETVKQVLQQMSLDPNIKLSPEVQKRLEEEGISAVRRDPNAQYNAEYNTGDKSITFRDQVDATADNSYHELGHHIYSNKLTPEEKAMFADLKGRASTEAAGRAGYTADDLASEDFSDYMRLALTGRIDEVPESVRPVIQKYSKVAAKEAEKIGVTLPKADEALRFTDVNRNSKAAIKNPILAANLTGGAGVDPLSNVLDAFRKMDNPKEIRGVIDELMPGLSTGQKKRLAEKLAKATDENSVVEQLVKANEVSDAAKPIEASQQAFEANTQAVEDISKAQTGTAEVPGQVPGSTAAPEVAGSPGENLGTVVNENADKAAKQTAEDLFPDADPESKKAIQEVMDSLRSAGKSYDEAAVIRKGERAAKAQAGKAAYEAAGGGEAGVRAKLAAQKGKLTQSGFNPIEVSADAQKSILDDVEGSDLMDYEKLNTQNAFRKLWGASEDKPAPHDIKKIKDYFNSKEAGLGDEAEKMINEAIDSGDSLDLVEQLAGVPRTLMTVGDASAPRNLAVAFVRHPVTTTKAYLESFPQMFSKGKFDVATEKLASLTDEGGKNYFEFMDSVMNLHLPNVAEKAAEESTSSAPLLGKIPVVGKVVYASNRGMSAAVTKTRFELAKKFIDDNGGIEKTMENFSKKDLSDLGEVLNTITGRGGKAGGFIDQHAKILSNTLFSGRLWASRLNMLNLYWYYRLSPAARKEAVTSAAAFAAQAGVVLTLIDKLPGVDVGADPTSADFAKIKVGNTRYDILGGLQQNIRVGAQIATGKRTNSETGDSKETTAASVLGGLIESKANPLLGYAYKMLNTTDDPNSDNPLARLDEWDNEINSGKEGAKLAVPLPISGVKETMDDQGNAKGFAMSLPGFFGAGTQTYGSTPTKDQGKTASGTPTFKGKVTPDMVLDDNGQPMLDAKGKVVKVKFDKDASEAQKKAALIEAKNRAYTDKAKSLLSPEDADIYALGEADSSQLDAAQLKKYNQVKKWVSSYGRAVDVPREVTSDAAKGFYQKWNSMSKDDQQSWLKEAPDENATKIAADLNKERTQGLSEFKPSNELSKAYAEYEKDILSHPEYTEVDKRNKAREFQKFAYRLNYSQDQRDIYTEGSSSDLRYLIDEKQISKADLDAAIKMDDELYNSGITGSLKFSKKFRNEYGYGLPDGGGKNENVARGGGSGDETPKTGITSLLPSFATTSKGGDKPTFSTKPRTKGISFKVDTPSKSGKKISIKL